MNTIPQDKLTHIASQTGNLVELVNDGIGWANTFLSNENKVETNYDVKKYRRTLKKIKAVVDKKPVIALFGASQVGKSYMANNLLYDENNKLEVFNHLDNKTIDFIKYINPEGNQNEATGAITRFTSDIETDASKYPVQVKIFSVRDIICILCDTYFYDYQDNKEIPKVATINELIQDSKKYINKQTNQSFFDDDDIFEIQEYLAKYFFDKALVIGLNDTDFWNTLADQIQHVEPSNWINVIGILWNNHPEINDIFRTAINSLSTLAFNTNVRVGFDALLRSDKKSIVDVATLNKFFEDTDSIAVQMPDKQIKSIAAGKLAFLTCEVVLSISPASVQNRPFINQIDIIDFPGARTRPEIQDFSQKSLLEMLLRGKVSYLFNNYSANYKSNILSVCMRTAQTNVTSVPRLINQWIEDNLGHSPKERAKNITSAPSPLFVIFTWWNTQLLFIPESDSPDPTDRIEKLFETRYKEEIQGGYKWHQEWVEENGGIKKFSNFYLLRDFVRSKEIFKQHRNDEGIFVNEQEDLPFPEKAKEKFYDDYKEKFVEYHKGKNLFFENPETAFLEASKPNQDGSEYIIKNLIPVSSNTVSVPIYLNVLNDAVAKLNKELGKHYHSSDSEESLRKSAQDATNIQFKMDIVFGLEAYYFGSFIEHLTLTESEIVTFYHDLLVNRVMVEKKDTSAYVLLRTRNNNLDATKTFDENLTILMNNYHLGSLEETKKHFEENESIDLNELFYGGKSNLKENSLVLAEAAREYWFDTKLNTDKFQVFIDKGLEKGMLIKLFDNLKVSYDKKVKMTGRIASQVRHFVDVERRIDKAEDMVAHITAGLINEFITSFGWSFYSEEDKEKLVEANKNSHLRLSIPNDKELFQSLERINEPNNDRMSVEYLLDYMNDLASNLNKIPIDQNAIEHVPMIKNYKRWSELMKISFIANNDIPTYNIEANKKLGTILEKIKEYHFAL
jgi:hypothetical protein